MGIQYSDVKYYRSVDVDFSDPTLNGGGIGEEIINDTLHSIFPEISATQRENGVVLRAKMFVANESADRKMQDTIFYIKQEVQPEDYLTLYSSDGEDTHESDEDFDSKKKYKNSVIKSTVIEGITTVDIPIVDKEFYDTGDNVIILDEYFRATYRGTIESVEDSASDSESATITLSTAYTSTSTIPAMAGYLANGFMATLAPGENSPMWIELTVVPTNAIDAEIVNQFQIGVHFDDVAN